MVPIFFNTHILRTTLNSNIIWLRSNYTRRFIWPEPYLFLLYKHENPIWLEGLLLSLFFCYRFLIGQIALELEQAYGAGTCMMYLWYKLLPNKAKAEYIGWCFCTDKYFLLLKWFTSVWVLGNVVILVV